MKRRKYPRKGIVKTRFGLAKLIPKNITAPRYRKMSIDSDAPPLTLDPSHEIDTTRPAPPPPPLSPKPPRFLRDFFRLIATREAER